MILTLKDRNRFLKAALKTTDPEMKRWLVACVDALDALPEGQNGAECPDFQSQATGPALADIHGRVAHNWQDGMLQVP
jgi:hypothetical protein